MTKLAISTAVAFALATLVSAAPALADHNPGAVQNGNQCWKDTVARKGEFGYWAACPSTASVAAAPKHVRRHRG
jgi:hypothetical protein